MTELDEEILLNPAAIKPKSIVNQPMSRIFFSASTEIFLEGMSYLHPGANTYFSIETNFYLVDELLISCGIRIPDADDRRKG